MLKRYIYAVISAIFISGVAAAQQPQPTVSNSNDTANSVVRTNDLNRRTFDMVWQKVRDTHYDPDFGGVDWNKVREKYEPQLAGIKDNRELHRMLQAMLGELKVSHFNIIPPEAIISNEEKEPSTADIGIDLRIIDGQAVITKVEPGSKAETAGLRPGFIIKRIDGRNIDEMKSRLAGGSEPEERKILRFTRWVKSQLGGAPDTSVSVLYLDEKERSVEKVVIREKMKGELSPPLGNFPPQYTEFESRLLPEKIGYIRFNIFTTPVMQKIRDAVRGFTAAGDGQVRAEGIIFDLRGNPGGLGGMAPGIAGMLVTEAGSLGTMKMRRSELKFAFFPQKNAFTGPVVILMDGLSASTSEVFSSGMQEIGRAVVVGDKSMGAALPSYFHKLPTGALLQAAIADFRTPKGVLIEGQGVIPDIAVKLDRESLLAGRDTQLEAAIAQIKNKAVR